MTEAKITYQGHSMFEIESESGVKIITDPYNEQIKSILPDYPLRYRSCLS